MISSRLSEYSLTETDSETDSDAMYPDLDAVVNPVGRVGTREWKQVDSVEAAPSDAGSGKGDTSPIQDGLATLLPVGVDGSTEAMWRLRTHQCCCV